MRGIPLVGSLIGMLAGFAGGLIVAWFTFLTPMQAHLDARERSLQQWARLHREEREAIGTIKTLSTSELRGWVALIDEQNRRFARLEHLIHEQEVQLVGPSGDLVMIASVVVLGVVGLVVFLLRDANASAAVTLDNLAALPPQDVLRVAVVARAPRTGPPALVSPMASAGSRSMDFTPAPPREFGTVCAYGGTSGWIKLRNGSRLPFQDEDIARGDRRRVRPGVRVGFVRGEDHDGRAFATDVRVLGQR